MTGSESPSRSDVKPPPIGTARRGCLHGPLIGQWRYAELAVAIALVEIGEVPVAGKEGTRRVGVPGPPEDVAPHAPVIPVARWATDQLEVEASSSAGTVSG